MICEAHFFAVAQKKGLLCRNRAASNDCLPYEKSSSSLELLVFVFSAFNDLLSSIASHFEFDISKIVSAK